MAKKKSKTASKKTHKIKLVVGDWSRDGHGQKADTHVDSNLNWEELEDAYKKGVKIIGFDLTKDIACEYEDSKLSVKYASALSKHGYDLEEIDADTVPPEHEKVSAYYLYPDTFADIWLFIAKLGNPDFDYEINQGVDTIGIGGYGLFYC